ncbi:fumarylacetoacetate hydrolase family protein [Bradyrhizobium liaoningense]|uniref:fumarylacetoacetate hydrolase family protein n=1 Tax=Bradyrhizobium liaoningense TaxID=43992 RepID=UPI001BA88E89|nr:fumarylacetoacetate hydrolase family protein [Bradyrhizobium liaoningense]MBR0859105.1 fumarylacetoacetate hydrolase family protein [Bradyrhizobium liaoningense]
MKLATLQNGMTDGELVVVARDLASFASVKDIAPTLQAALDDWHMLRPRLEERYRALNGGTGGKPFDPASVHSPLPRAFQWCDGSVYEPHMQRMAKWIGKPPEPRFFEEPWMYQGASDGFLSPMEDIRAESEDWGIDYESEIAVITTKVPYAASVKRAGESIALVMLCNDVSLRNLIPAELAKGFGFVQSKPASAFSPVAVTLDELGAAWRDCRLHGRVHSYVNENLFGDPDAGAMVHGFDRIVAHAAKTRALSAGSIIGGGTIANDDLERGTSCIAERRVLETFACGKPITPYLRFGDRVRIEMFGDDGRSIFGAIHQKVARAISAP